MLSTTCGCGVHGVYIAQVYHNRFIAEVFQRCIHKIETHAFEQQQVGAYDRLPAEMIHYGAIIADTRIVETFFVSVIPGQVVDQAEFTQRRYFVRCSIASCFLL